MTHYLLSVSEDMKCKISINRMDSYQIVIFLDDASSISIVNFDDIVNLLWHGCKHQIFNHQRITH